MEKKGIILWDIDGTLLFNRKKSYQSVHYEVLKLAGYKVKKSGIKVSGLTDYETLLRCIESKSSSVQKSKLLDIFIELDKCYFCIMKPEELKLHSGITFDLMHKLSQKWELGVLTGNTHFRAFLKLSACNFLNIFDTNFIFTSKFGESRFDISERASKVINRKMNLKQKTKIIVGDTPHDINAGHRASFKVISVATGDYTYSELNTLNPDRVIRNFQIDQGKFQEILEHVS